MNKIFHAVMAFLTGGQSDFAFPLSHLWHGINVAPPLYLIAFTGAVLAAYFFGVVCWQLFRRKPTIIAVLLCCLSATAAYAASSTLANLSAVSSVNGTDLFYDVQGGADYKATAAQIAAYVAASASTIPVTSQSGTTYTLASTDCGSWINFTSNSAVTVTIPATLATGCSIAMLQAGTAKVSVNGSAVTAATLETYGGTATGTAGQWAAIGITIEANVGGSSAVAVLQGSSS